MKMSRFVLFGLSALISTSFCFASTDSSDYQTIPEKLIFSITTSPENVSKTPPSPIILMMGHKEGLKTRDFYLDKNSDYGEMKSLSRHHLTGEGRIGGYFTDEVISKDESYVLILSGQVHEKEEKGKKIYSKQGTWMDSLGRQGTWKDEEQESNPETALAACGGK